MREEIGQENSEQNVFAGEIPMSMIPSHQSSEDQSIDNILIQEYERFLSGKAEGTIDAYVRTIRHVMTWVAHRPGSGGRFHPQQLTKTVVEVYLAFLEQEGFSLNYRAREIDHQQFCSVAN